MANLSEWLSLPTDPYRRPPYDRPCPSCAAPMSHPTSCKCDFERQVFALAGLELGDPYNRINVIKVNKAMRALDDSGSYPIQNRFNGTERAIRRVRRNDCFDGLDGYVRMVDYHIGQIVNSLP